MHEQLHEIRYEGYGPGGVAVMIDCQTRDRDHAAALLRETLRRSGGSLGAEGSVGYLFHPVGLLRYAAGAPAARVKEAAFAAGAEDVVTRADGRLDVLTDPAELAQVRTGLTQAGLSPAGAGETLYAASLVRLEGAAAAAMKEMLQALKSLECVHQVYSNADVPSDTAADDAILARL